MLASELKSILEDTESGLNGVSESMVNAELPRLEESRVVLGQLVDALTRVNRSLPAANADPSDSRLRLENIRSKLMRIQSLGDAAAFMLKIRSHTDALSGYTTSGVAKVASDLRTISLEY